MSSITVVLCLLFAGVTCGNYAFKRIDSILQESSCLTHGGTCTIETDCPPGLLSEKRGLCPKQRSQGIECCHGASIKETRCGKMGGRCMNEEDLCNPRLLFKEATDCEEGFKCCILTL